MGMFQAVQSTINLPAQALVIYTGNGFDSTKSGAGTDEDNHELTTITSNQIGDYNYLKISIFCKFAYYYTGGSRAVPWIKIQTKDVGGAYADSMAYKQLVSNDQTATLYTTSTITWLHTLTAAEKAAGIVTNIWSKVVAEAGTVGEVTNIQTVLELYK